MLEETLASWRTTRFRPVDQFAVWRSMLRSAYGVWELERPASERFRAEMNCHTAGSLQIVECVCDPCAATRRPTTAKDMEEHLTLQLVLSGRENFSVQDSRYTLTAGDVLIWDTTRSMRFEITERLHKISVTMPLARFRAWLPRSWHGVRNSFPSGTDSASVLFSFVSSIAPRFLTGKGGNSEALTEALLGTLVYVLDVERNPESDGLRETQLARVKHYIDKRLDDPELSPPLIAKANRISLRYLHSLFEREDTTVFQYVIQHRLERCQRELANPIMARRTITEIALSCGFQNPAHFSRRFKSQFGVSPKEFREAATSA